MHNWWPCWPPSIFYCQITSSYGPSQVQSWVGISIVNRPSSATRPWYKPILSTKHAIVVFLENCCSVYWTYIYIKLTLTITYPLHHNNNNNTIIIIIIIKMLYKIQLKLRPSWNNFHCTDIITAQFSSCALPLYNSSEQQAPSRCRILMFYWKARSACILDWSVRCGLSGLNAIT